ncbi:divalent-cation tolerance protein CutA [Prosthecobacter dejongeii]|uniref:Periplasmic divalent cation tolerance protein n=1 Tax=Prosthecobacter dejongeii TaxID=48465 RepID=A0A7W7YH77_9BACT|nr:divalent-cation tolerance protein CutA [Prosthecobacter dejongeii]MBB5036136.1 periplasmic divalent cation tolerance protein [Prosthecobacter dejongeii]
MTDILLVLSTFPDAEKARQTGTLLVESQLAACVNLCPGVTSIYRWKGEIESSSEVLALFKTTRAQYPALELRLRELHPYEVPEILAIPAERAYEAYAQWVMDQTRS